MGLNYYSPWIVRASTAADSAPDIQVSGSWATAPGTHAKTDIGWDIYPPGFHDILVRMTREVGPLPIEITENGAAYNFEWAEGSHSASGSSTSTSPTSSAAP